MKHFDASYYDEDYFKPGPKSSYTMPFTWEVEEKVMMDKAARLISGFSPKSVFDIGCARGFLLKALFRSGVKQIMGIDISRWAIDNADPQVKPGLICADIRDIVFVGDLAFIIYDASDKWGGEIDFHKDDFDLVISDSTLEHIEEEYIPSILRFMRLITNKWVYISTPVVLSDEEKPWGDPSHVTYKTPGWWISKAQEAGLLFDLRYSNMTSDHPCYNANLVFSKYSLKAQTLFSNKARGP